MNESGNYKGVCRTALATPGLLITSYSVEPAVVRLSAVFCMTSKALKKYFFLFFLFGLTPFPPPFWKMSKRKQKVFWDGFLKEWVLFPQVIIIKVLLYKVLLQKVILHYNIKSDWLKSFHFPVSLCPSPCSVVYSKKLDGVLPPLSEGQCRDLANSGVYTTILLYYYTTIILLQYTLAGPC